MMKKKVKKIPKYNAGGSVLDTILKNNQLIAPSFNPQNNGVSSATAGTIAAGKTWSNMNNTQRTGAIVDASGVVLNGIGNIGKPATLSGAIQGGLSGASAGAAIGGPLGAGIGFAAGTLFNSIGNKASTDGYGNYKKSTGITRLLGIGKSDSEIIRQANIEKNSMISQQQTQAIQSDYYNENPTGSINVLAAEGGIMRQPVDALVSPGEIAINPYTLQYRQFGSDNEEPNSKDNIKTVLETGDNVKSHAKHMIMPNGKTPADNSKMVLDSNMPEEMKRKMIKKIDNWESAHRTKPQEYAKFDEGGITKYGYNKNLSEFAYWDKDKNEYKKEYLDWVNNLTEQDVRDIEAGKYGDMTEYFSKNKGKKLDVATAQKLMTDKKYGNWHKIGQAVVDNKIKTKGPDLDYIPRMAKQINIFPGMTERVVHHRVGDAGEYADLTNLYKIGLEIPKLKKLPNPSEADGIIAAYKTLNKGKGTPDWLSNIADFAPTIAALFGDYDYHTESSQISPPRFVPVNADPRPLLRAADESSSIGNYNLANMGVGTGAYLAHSAQLASDRAKRYADAYKWQQETNNKLIAQNAGIYNDWRKQRDAYATQAIADTRANEGAAQQMRDSAIRDAYEFVAGRRNDRMRLAMMEPLAKYAFDDDTYKKIYSRAIV